MSSEAAPVHMQQQQSGIGDPQPPDVDNRDPQTLDERPEHFQQLHVFSLDQPPTGLAMILPMRSRDEPADQRPRASGALIRWAGRLRSRVSPSGHAAAGRDGRRSGAGAESC